MWVISREHYKRCGVYRPMLNIASEQEKYYPQYTASTSFATEADANKL